MLCAQKKCKHHHTRTVSFSASLDLPPKRIQFWNTAIRRRKGVKVSVNLWKRQKKKTKVEVPTRDITDKDLNVQLCLARRDYRAAKKQHEQHQDDTLDKKVWDRLRRAEQAWRLGMLARAINGKLDSLSVLRVEHNGVQCKTQAAIEGALFPINKAKVHSSEDTDFFQPPEKNFGLP